jgi:hypothetical protein
MDEYRLPETLCPVCDHLLIAAINFRGDGTPRIGDVTVCINCSAVLRFCAEDQLQKISDDELAELALQDPRIFSLLMTYQNAFRTLMKDKKTEPSSVTGTSFCRNKTLRRRRHRKNGSTGLRGRIEP